MLRTHGASVTLVHAIVPEGADPAGAETWVLRRDVRGDVRGYFATDALVVACPADPDPVALIAGQGDLAVAVVAKQHRTTIGEVRDAVAAVEAAQPVVVLVP